MVEVLVVVCTLLSVMLLVLALVLRAQTYYLMTIAREVPLLTDALIKQRIALTGRDMNLHAARKRSSIVDNTQT